jgi:chemotaxis protein methyltransferase CheR
VMSRLGKRLRTLETDIKGYAVLLESDPQEQITLIDLLSTNHTFWWRESSHFIDLCDRILKGHRPGSLRMWSVATSTGDEAYSMALCLRKAVGTPVELSTMDASILATDISTRALGKAKRGRYTEEAVSRLDVKDRLLALIPLATDESERWEVRPELRRLVHFARLNLMDKWPMRGPFDVIFCRNVLIYFNTSTKQRMIGRLRSLLRSGGTLYLGHAESLVGPSHELRTIAPSVYTTA